ncbi:MAG: hypothetical protein PHP25_05020, partial [Candidatus Moranbacteria bacterium]|nr:hypothetical protein [Candidatus Moranbacteria bacterium]
TGKNAGEKIRTIKPGQLVGVGELQDTRTLYHKIMEDPGHEASLEEIRAALSMYERFFRGIEMID